jgi:phosphoglycerate kinase
MKLSITQLDLRGRRVFLRADFNVPLSRDQITDDARIRDVLPTLRHCLTSGASVVLASHLGRPSGKDAQYSLKPVAFRLEELLERPVALVPDCVGPVAEKLAAALQPGDCLLLENLRFHPEEAANEPAFAQALARLADCYVNDAFSVSHRVHASVVGITRFLRPAAAGFLMLRELITLGRVLNQPKRPLVLILGGARVSDKLGIIRNLVPHVDRLLVGGAMAFTFLKALGAETGISPVEKELVPMAKKILDEARVRQMPVVLPEDVVAATYPGDRHRMVTGPAKCIGLALAGFDIGPATVIRFRAALRDAGTVVWNGPMGMVEQPPFALGTTELAKALGDCGGLTVAAGGDTVAAIRRAGLADRLSYLSPSGGAFLEALEGRELPGVVALSDMTPRPPAEAPACR